MGLRRERSLPGDIVLSGSWDWEGWERCILPRTASWRCPLQSRSCSPSSARIRVRCEGLLPRQKPLCCWRIRISCVHNFEDGPELKFLVMEYVEGENLAQRIARLGKLNEGEVRRIGAEICKGLEHAHAKKVIHRDLKPANVMVGQEGTCKIADFGIARICRDSISRLTSMQD